MQESLLILIGLYITSNLIEAQIARVEESIRSLRSYLAHMRDDSDEIRKRYEAVLYSGLATPTRQLLASLPKYITAFSIFFLGAMFVIGSGLIFVFDSYVVYRTIVGVNLMAWLLQFQMYFMLHLKARHLHLTEAMRVRREIIKDSISLSEALDKSWKESAEDER